MLTETCGALAARLDGYDHAVEIGIGRRPDVARSLAERGVTVTATDVHDRPTPEGVRFVRDDVTDPTLDHYCDADVVYALNCPPELQRPLVDLARRVGAACYFTTLGADPAVVPVSRESISGETLFRASGVGGPGHDAPTPLRGERP